MDKIIAIRFFLVMCLAFTLNSCDPCLGTGFGACGAYFNFIVRDKVSKYDLVLGPNAVYNVDSIRIIPSSDNQYPVPVGISNNLLFSQGQNPADTLFLKLSETDTDTLLMKYHFKKSYCCRTGRGFGTVSSIKFNGQPAIQESGAYIFEK